MQKVEYPGSPEVRYLPIDSAPLRGRTTLTVPKNGAAATITVTVPITAPAGSVAVASVENPPTELLEAGWSIAASPTGGGVVVQVRVGGPIKAALSVSVVVQVIP